MVARRIKDRLRIVYLITRMDSLGGAQVHVRDMALAMRELGHQVIVLCNGEGDFTRQLVAAGIDCHEIPGLQRSLHPLSDFRAFLAIRCRLMVLRPDLLSLHSSKAGWLGRLAGAQLGIPTVFTAHGWSFSGGLPPLRGGLYLWLEKLLAPLTRQLICVSRADHQLGLTHRLALPDRISLIHNGVHDVSSDLRARPTLHPPRLVMVARFQEPKDHIGLFRALAALKTRDWSLELIGGGPLLAKMRTLAADLGLEQQLIFSGECTDVEVRLAKAQIFILLSRREGFPRSILEAMRAGLPVIASNVGGICEALTHGGNGYLLPAEGDTESLLQFLLPLLDSPALREKMGEAGRVRFAREFSFPVMFQKTLDLYHRVLELT